MESKAILTEREREKCEADTNAVLITRLTGEKEKGGGVLRVENKWHPAELSNSSRRLTPECAFMRQTAGWQHPANPPTPRPQLFLHLHPSPSPAHRPLISSRPDTA